MFKTKGGGGGGQRLFEQCSKKLRIWGTRAPLMGTIQMANTSDVVRQKDPSHVLHTAPHLLLLLLHLRQLLGHPTLIQLLQGFLRQQPHHIGTK